MYLVSRWRKLVVDRLQFYPLFHIFDFDDDFILQFVNFIALYCF
jgi:hypothetical protein